ncbi:ADL083Cp [Eremothecium gossypii ATCC 10895]|uniref:ADL083Cp n=1 Tax=Eremothecium gossypii (strain ATCC 10895 / CBS 109.51 / FGSC 9923 / NRRL Y-1056) TaxID=284811 RepID=Q75AL0_EREGS|nr:ADL083Cp [Eremothecium gossypii ATCC 10895]AAS51837.2 ADL083Cp [Eremothecium gossypii ATCC 10895]AEY96134.1 FADL083Cp [Eremothecium gossypii FDAG1]
MNGGLGLQKSNIYIKPRSSQEGKYSSLALLRKPQRISSRTEREEQENILKRNTDYNRKRGGGTWAADENIDPLDGDESPRRAGSPVVLTDYFSQSHAGYDNVGHQRSKSLPGTPTSALKRPGGVRRSKSVHFDNRDVVSVKYFNSDESTLLVAHAQSFEDQLRLRQDARELAPNGLTLVAPAGGMAGGAKSPRKPLRKSKCFRQYQLRPQLRTLRNVNFPILANKDPAVLTLNIFLNIAYNRKVFLQDLSLDSMLVMTGRVLVKNIHYDKSVIVRYTWDNWAHTSDTASVWISSGNAVLPGKDMDLFEFAIDVPAPVSGTPRLEFCIRYQVRDNSDFQTHWDNNHGNNYVVEYD